jgi:hypothetical protein
MRTMNFSLRLQPSLMEEARKAAASEGVSLNQMINVAVAEKVAALRTEIYLHERIRRAHHEEALRIFDRALQGNPPMEGDELLPGGLPSAAEGEQVQPAPVSGGLQGFDKEPQPEVQAATPPDSERAGEVIKVFGTATPQFGLLKRRLEKTRGR